MPVQVVKPPLVAPRAQALSLLEALHIVTHMSALYSCSKWDLHLGTTQSLGTRVACGLVALHMHVLPGADTLQMSG